MQQKATLKKSAQGGITNAFFVGSKNASRLFSLLFPMAQRSPAVYSGNDAHAAAPTSRNTETDITARRTAAPYYMRARVKQLFGKRHRLFCVADMS